ncbi:hypothetical protein BS50DRAFT_212359 [Corynespora cassiicola Philippines]|uniref:DUF7907 domain-containing protein n=1 Tax=Corynespora cassiicola Philippines TaxID=1448308 RepID=A0A2T2N481_CORCC|nr:hypothetical protein BS50DRAFT_212359 [Corynespora cassiicola Philippines]
MQGTALAACHQGAAIEGLCLSGELYSEPASHSTTFYHNVTAGSDLVDEGGILGWSLTYNYNLTAPSSMQFSINPTSNVAIPIIYPGWTQYTLVNFDESGSMYIPWFVDDTKSPPEYPSPALKLKNWYICLTRWSYLYTTLTWKIGVTGEPQNPSCQKVDVTRVYV